MAQKLFACKSRCKCAANAAWRLRKCAKTAGLFDYGKKGAKCERDIRSLAIPASSTHTLFLLPLLISFHLYFWPFAHRPTGRNNQCICCLPAMRHVCHESLPNRDCYKQPNAMLCCAALSRIRNWFVIKRHPIAHGLRPLPSHFVLSSKYCCISSGKSPLVSGLLHNFKFVFKWQRCCWCVVGRLNGTPTMRWRCLECIFLVQQARTVCWFL